MLMKPGEKQMLPLKVQEEEDEENQEVTKE